MVQPKPPVSCWYEADRLFEIDDVLPIGRPFRNTQIMLLDDQDGAKPGELGEICIRGTSLTMAITSFDKTNECFVQNPLNTGYPN